MNPFVEHTVARASPLSQWRRPRRAPASDCPRAGRRALRQALNVLLLTAGLGVAAPPAGAVDANQATAAQLEGVRGIGPRTAEIIVRERERGGAFESLEDLSERVRGIGQKKAQALQAAGLTVGSQPAAAEPPGAAATTAKPAQGRSVATKPGASAAAPTRAKP
ncbi:ComEA family DNA-binding protein [Achromobacter deleyi]|uniref:ComEA family DNA-binding protein n=1 Tax=Achromobacter deleyi TaxID=1353891 RepID=UPI001492D499|nr:helix-hairpin-helix domain-containing protein [Achromobacter deleyi]QVQ29504.1 helix-hairpin-helix domain-containing protein [Achromobacter deleyi]UIP19627.1 helix-hairpin-helix domain-containing protein [Achromobacter deleyi]